MITEMKKLELLLYHREKEQFLQALREAGVVHITEHSKAITQAVEDERARVVHVDRVITELKRRKSKSGAKIQSGEELLELFQSKSDELELLNTNLSNVVKEIAQLTPWGDFNPELFDKLRENGVNTRFFEVNQRHLSLFSEVDYEIIATVKSTTYLVTIEEGTPKVISGCESLVLPVKSLSDALREKDELSSTIKGVEEFLDQLAGARELLDSYRNELDEKLVLELARLSMVGMAENKILHLEGWLPVGVESAVEKVLSEFSCWFELSVPTHEDSVPVKLKNRGGAKLFESITKIFSLPDYFEIDPTPLFAPFYALFFGLCLGDLGYGALLLILAGIGFAKVKESIKPVMILGMVLGVATMLSGVLLNTVFGEEIVEGWTAFTFLGATADGQFPAMAFSVYLGVVQIILAMKIKALNGFRRGGWQYLMYPAGTILLVLWVSLSLINIDFLGTATFWNIATNGKIAVDSVAGSIPAGPLNVIGIVGIVLVMLFNAPEKKLLARLAPGGLGAIYNFATGFMGDALSYIRLFALGLAGGLLGNAFNQIGFMVSGGDAPKIMIIFTILILVLGHTINFALAALGSFVHPLRLTFVEFYKNIDFKGGAEAYKPFMKTEKN